MGDSEETAAQKDEQGGATAVLSGGDDDNPTAGQDLSGGAPVGKPQQTAPQTPQLDTSQKIHPHVAILAGLVNKVLSGIQNAPGNPNNAFDRGFMQASPQVQQQKAMQQQQQQAALQAQLSANEMNAVKLRTARLQDMITTRNLLHADDARKQQILDSANNEYDALEGKGLISDKQSIDGEGIQFYNQAVQLADQLQKKIGGVTAPEHYMVFADTNDLEHAHFIVGKINPQDTVQDSEGNKYSVADYMHLGASDRLKIGKSAVKDKITKDLADTYFKPIKEGEMKYGETRDEAVRQADQDLGTPGLPDSMKQAIQQRKQNLQAMHPAFQSPAEERQKEEKQRQLDREANREASHADDSVYAYDPETKSYELTTRANAGGRETFKQTPEFDKALGRAQRIQDVSNKILDYRDTFTHGLSTSDKHAIENFESEHPTMITGPGLGSLQVKAGAEGAGLEEAARDLDQRQMSDDAKARLRAFIVAKTTALEMQRIETDTGRMSTGGMKLDLGVLPRPSDDPQTALDKTDKFMRSVKTFGKTRVKGIPTPDEIEGERPFDLKSFEDWQAKQNAREDKAQSMRDTVKRLTSPLRKIGEKELELVGKGEKKKDDN